MPSHPNRLAAAALILPWLAACLILPAQDSFTPEDVLKTRVCTTAAISPGGDRIAYTVSVPREAGDEPGAAYSELWVVSTRTRLSRPYITGKVNIASPQWSPDGGRIAFILRRGENAASQVWTIPLEGGEAAPVTRSETDVASFRWHPSGSGIAYVASTPAGKRDKAMQKKGYGFVFYEENLPHRNLYLCETADPATPGKTEALTEGITVWDFEFSPDGRAIAAACSARNLVDEEYMFQKIHLLDLGSRRLRVLVDPRAKLGNFRFSPDGSRLAYAAGLGIHDHAVSQAFVIDIASGKTANLTPTSFAGHVTWTGWKDSRTILYTASEGVWATWNARAAAGGKSETLLHAKTAGFIPGAPSATGDFRTVAMIGTGPAVPGDVFCWSPGKPALRMTEVNPWIAQRKLGRQEIIRYPARDKREIEGILVYPVDAQPGKACPLIVSVHGGPESNHSNGWLTSYSSPAQVYAGRGYLTFFPNYRSSTGYGIDFAMTGYGDPAGKEFDDIADGIEFLAASGLADRGRVGLGGGSYGGYAAAWFASYYTRLVRAVVMFVGISDLVSKRLTTDIPFEELHVHSGRKIEEMWDLELKRSPVYWAHQSRTAVLILGGTNDTRVDPGQSLEFFRVLKMNGHPAVRLVQYPGEGHGNRRQPGRTDFLHRHLRWFDWYVRDGKPLDGPMPPLDISDAYGLKWTD